MSLFVISAGLAVFCFFTQNLLASAMMIAVSLAWWFFTAILEKELQSKLEDINKLSEENAQNKISASYGQIAEDIRGPLASLTTLARLSHEMTTEKKELLQVAVARLRGIVDDLLKPTQKTSETSELISVIEPLLKEYRFSHPQVGWAWHNHLSSARASVAVNTVALQRTLSQILNGTLDMLPETGPSIEVTLLERPEHFILQIRDNGSATCANLSEIKAAFASLGAELQVRAREGMGTQIILLFAKVNSSEDADKAEDTYLLPEPAATTVDQKIL